MNKEKQLLKDMQDFCGDVGITMHTLQNRLRYPMLKDRITGENVKGLKKRTIERIYNEMDLMRFQYMARTAKTLEEAETAAKWLLNPTEEEEAA